MGTCGSHPPSYTLQDLQNLGLNQTKQASTGCCPNIGGGQSGSGQQKCRSKGFSWPNNDEFAWGGLGGSCSMCSDTAKGYGCSSPCGSGGGTIGGSRPTVKRIAYNADPKDCCLHASQSNPIRGNKTCAPDYRGINASGCFDELQSHCSSSRAFNNECISWGSSSPQAQASIDIAKAVYCNNPNNYRNNPDCRDWCNTDGRGKCDRAVTDFCADNANKDNNICSCINSPLVNPQCSVITQDGEDLSDVDCQHGGGYWTSNMTAMVENQACPDTYNCRQDFNIGGSHSIVRDNWMIQVCGPGAPIPEPGDEPPVLPETSRIPVTTLIHTTTIPGTDISLPDIPGIPQEDFIKGFPNTLIVMFILIIVIVLTMTGGKKKPYIGKYQPRTKTNALVQ